MKNLVSIVAVAAITLGCLATASAQSIGSRTITLNDGAGGKVVISPATPASGTFTIPSGGGTLVPNGSSAGQVLRWNNGTSAWEVGSMTNIGNNLTVPSAITATAGDVTATAGKLVSGTTLGNSGTPTAGAVYVDNVVRAWGNIPAAGTTANGSFGISSYTHTNGTGVYDFTLSTPLASTSDGSVVITSRDTHTAAWAYFTSASTIHVMTYSDFGVTAADEAFCFQLVGR